MAERLQQTAQQPIVKIGHYTLGQTLGVGTFGKVKSKCRCDLCETCVIPFLIFRPCQKDLTRQSNDFVVSQTVGASHNFMGLSLLAVRK